MQDATTLFSTPVTQITKGSVVVLGGRACRVIEDPTLTAAFGRGDRISLKAAGLFDAVERECTLPSSETIDVPMHFHNAYALVAYDSTAETVTLEAETGFRTFEVPLELMINENNYNRHEIEWEGRMEAYYAVEYEGYNIWGATAGMLRNLSRRMQT